MIMRVILACFFSFCFLQLLSQTTWVKRYSYSDDIIDYFNCRSVTALEDGIIIIGSEEHADDPTGWKLGIYKIDWQGNLQNAVLYGEPWTANQHGWANSADLSHEGGVINGGNYHVWAIDGEALPENEVIPLGQIVQISPEGNIDWVAHVGDSIHFHTLRQIKATSDGGYIAIGQAELVQYHPQIWVVKTDGAGNMEWQNYFGGAGPNDYYNGFHIAELPDGGYVLGGYYDWQPYVETGILIKLNAQGNFSSSVTTGLGSVPNGSMDGLLVLDNGDVITATMREFLSEENYTIRVARVHRLNSQLQNIWVSEVGLADFKTSVNHFLSVDENSVLAVGTTKHFEMNALYMGHLTKINLDDGSIIWQRTLSAVDNGINYMFDADHTPDGGFVAAGYCLAVPGDEFIGQQDAWVVKVDQHGCLVPGCHVGVEESENENGVRMLVYPNPTNGILNVYFESLNLRSGTFSLVDMQGRVLKQWRTDGSPTTYMADVSGLEAGVYVLRYEGVGVVLTEKIVIE